MEVKAGYKQTEVGIIPEEWEVHLLTNLSVISRLAGAEYTSLWEETPSGEITALRGFNIGQGRIIERDFVRISNKLSLKLKRSRLCRGDVVYPCVGSIGNAVVIEEDAKYHIQQNIARITPDSDTIDSYYLANFLMSSLAAREVERFTSSSSQPSVLVGSLRQYRIPLPPTITEQRAIAEALRDVDGLLGGLDRLIAKKRDLKQAAMQQLLTGQTRLPGFQGEWEVRTLGEITDSLDNVRVPLNEAQREKMRGDYPYCGANGVLGFVDGYVIDDDIILMAEDGGYFDEYETRPIAYRMTGKCWVNNHAHILKAKPGFDQGFLFYSLVHKNILPFLASGTRAKLNKSEMNKIEVRRPKEHLEQTAIAAVLSDMDAELAALEQRREKTRALKQAMMQELLTGRTRLV